jgi:hypothetical protein
MSSESVNPESSDSLNFKVVQWLAPSFVFVAIFFHAFDIYPLGPMFHLVGACLWSYVGFRKKQGPILLNFLPQIPVWTSGLVYWLVR